MSQVAVKKRKTKEEEAAGQRTMWFSHQNALDEALEEELTTKAQSEVESAKSFFEDLVSATHAWDKKCCLYC